jgi:hypothetical protein
VEDSARCFATLVHGMAKLGQPHAGYLRRLSGALVEEAQHAEQAQRGTRRAQGAQQALRSQQGGSLKGQQLQQGQQQQQQQQVGAVDAGAGSGPGGQPQLLLAQLSTQQLCLFVYSLAHLGCTDGRALKVCLEEIASRGGWGPAGLLRQGIWGMQPGVPLGMPLGTRGQRASMLSIHPGGGVVMVFLFVTCPGTRPLL